MNTHPLTEQSVILFDISPPHGAWDTEMWFSYLLSTRCVPRSWAEMGEACRPFADCSASSRLQFIFKYSAVRTEHYLIVFLEGNGRDDGIDIDPFLNWTLCFK